MAEGQAAARSAAQTEARAGVWAGAGWEQVAAGKERAMAEAAAAGAMTEREGAEGWPRAAPPAEA